jgi:hypothetical protein
MFKVFAYLDAGTGSLILQAVGGAVITVLVFFRSFGRRLTSLLHFKKNKSDTKSAKTATPKDNSSK